MSSVRNKAATEYEAMKDELLHEVKTRQSKQGNAENGALTGGNASMQSLRRPNIKGRLKHSLEEYP